MMPKIISKKNQFELDLEVADTFMKRFKGLMFRSCLPVGKALMLFNCSSVHTCFMRFPIDVVYLNRNYIIVGIETLRPWGIGKMLRGTKMIVEMNEGAAKQLNVGEQLTLC